MGCCMCKKVLKILAGLAFIGIGIGTFTFNPWLVLGVFMLLVGIAPFVCNCESGCCMPGKKK